MNEEQVRAVDPAFTRYLGRFESYFDPRSVDHLRAYCRGLLTDLPRKSVEPIALAAGTAVRTLQKFLKDYVWDREVVRDELHRRVAAHLGLPHGLLTVDQGCDDSKLAGATYPSFECSRTRS